MPMRLKKIEITGYRSIKEMLTLHIDASETIILGQNDHGKTNVLNAVCHLNEDAPFSQDDLNWDLLGKEESLPLIKYYLELSASEAELIYRKRVTGDYFRNFRSHLQSLTLRAKLGDATADDSSAPMASSEGTSPSTPSARPASGGSEEHTDSPAQHADNVQATISLEATSHLYGFLQAVKGLPEYSRINTLSQILKKFIRDLNSASETIAERQQKFLASSQSELDQDTKSEEQKALIKKNILQYEKNIERLRGEINDRTALLTHPLLRIGRKVAPNTDAYPLVDVQSSIPVICERKGLKGGLTVDTQNHPLFGGKGGDLKKQIPRIEIIRPIESIPDAVTEDNVDKDEMEFMRGILYYAGIDDPYGVFKQNPANIRRLDEGSDRLSSTLRANWTQGADLKFLLRHDSSSDEIKLYIGDPAIANSYSRPSRRSNGFTHFFALKTILHARTIETEAQSFIWLFDEPGIYLHPKGQQDLIRVLETLSRNNQVIYTTHSIFMINRNFPHRHRLVKKTERGTQIQGKPYISSWKPTMNALGLYIPGGVFFSNKLLVVEGDSDPMFLGSIFRLLISRGIIDVDTNALTIVPTGDGKNADALIRIFLSSADQPEILVLCDGDEGGQKRMNQLRATFKNQRVQFHLLEKDCTIEDYLPGGHVAYLQAVARYVATMGGGQGNFVDKLVRQWHALSLENPNGHRLADFGRKEGARMCGREGSLSPIGIAREYEDVTTSLDPKNQENFDRAIALCKLIASKLSLMPSALALDKIVSEH